MCEIGISLTLEDSVRSSLSSEPSWIQNWMDIFLTCDPRISFIHVGKSYADTMNALE